MIRYLHKKMRYSNLRQKNSKNEEKSPAPSGLTPDLKNNIDILQKILGDSPDVIVRQFSCGPKHELQIALFFLDGMANKTIINDNIIRPLIYDSPLLNWNNSVSIRNVDDIQHSLISVGDVKKVDKITDMIKGVLYGDTLMLLDGCKDALLIDTKGWENRGVQEPSIDQVVRGPREGFTETIRFNTALLRRKILDPNLTIEQMIVGERTRTNIAIAYVKGIANPKVVEEVRRRIQAIKTDAILESGYIEQFIEDTPYSPFATVGNTEKPDIAAARMLEGRIVIIVDGTPFALTVPMLFLEGFQASEDYYSRPYYASLIRLIRFLSFFITLLAPAVYVALTTFHQELIPTPLLITMAVASEGTPFPAVLEALGMGIIYEILKEGGVRLPSQVGQALSIVGALVIGQAAVEAGLIGAPMVIVIAVTAIASFLVVSHTDAVTIIRFILIILAGILGAFGIVIGLMGVLIHLAALRSFGSPYLAPLAPLTIRDLKDVFIRAPIWNMFKRPRTISVVDVERQNPDLRPHPPTDNQNSK